MAQNRRFSDGPKLAKKYALEFVNDDVTKMQLDFDAPNDCLYSGYRFKVEVELEEGYPNSKAPLVHFVTKVLHPNVEHESGFPCISALENENWKESSKLEHIFEYILPHLFCNPNFDDPYNVHAAELFESDPEEYEKAVKDECQKYAKKT